MTCLKTGLNSGGAGHLCGRDVLRLVGLDYTAFSVTEAARKLNPMYITILDPADILSLGVAILGIINHCKWVMFTSIGLTLS